MHKINGLGKNIYGLIKLKRLPIKKDP